MGFWSDVASEITSGIKAVVTGIGKACMQVAKFVGEHSKLLAGACEIVAHVLKIVYPPLGIALHTTLIVAAKAFRVIGIVYDALQPGETIEEMGEKCLEAAENGVVPENYETWEEYSNAVRQTPLSDNPNKYSKDDKLIAGMTFVETKLRWVDNLDPQTIEVLLRYQDFFNQDRLTAYRQAGQTLGFRLSDLKDYFLDRSTAQARSKAYDFICQAERRYNPNYDEDALYKEINDLKKEVEEQHLQAKRANEALE